MIKDTSPTIETQAGYLDGSALRFLNADLASQAIGVVQNKIDAAKNQREGLIFADDYALPTLYQSIRDSIRLAGYDDAAVSLGAPTDKKIPTSTANIAFNASRIASGKGISSPHAAAHLANELSRNSGIAEANAIGAFVNLHCDFLQLTPTVLAQVRSLGDSYGHAKKSMPDTTIIDYSSPNVAKNMTVAHLRSTIIGESLRRIHSASGDVVIGINHIGDWGTQFGALLYSYQQEEAERGDEFLNEIAADPTSVLMRLYRQFNSDAKNNPELGNHARAIFLRLEKGDPDLVGLWSLFREWSLAAFKPVYEKLGVTFDLIQGESFYEDRMTPTVKAALEKGVLKVDERGATVLPSQGLTDSVTGKINDKIMLSKDGGPRDEVIMKPNGGTVYLTRDIAAIVYRAKELGATKALYVIGKEQGNHCLELFAVSHQIGALAMGTAQHISFGHLNVNGRKMKSREGTVVLLTDLINGATEAAAKLIEEAHYRRRGAADETSETTHDDPGLARQLGISALIFNDLRQDRTKDIEFNPDNLGTAVDEGSSIYIQYAHARLNSLLRNVSTDEIMPNLAYEDVTFTENQKNAIMQIARVPLVIKEAADSNAPHKIAVFLSSICRTANLLYSERKVSDVSNPAEREFIVELLTCLKQSIENLSYLVCIDLPGKL